MTSQSRGSLYELTARAIELFFTGADLYPAKITAALGLEPSAAAAPHRQTLLDLDGSALENDIGGMWCYSTAAALLPGPAIDHLLYLVDQLRDRGPALAALAAQYGRGHVTIQESWPPAQWNLVPVAFGDFRAQAEPYLAPLGLELDMVAATHFLEDGPADRESS